jgi:hypothetical protein
MRLSRTKSDSSAGSCRTTHPLWPEAIRGSSTADTLNRLSSQLMQTHLDGTSSWRHWVLRRHDLSQESKEEGHETQKKDTDCAGFLGRRRRRFIHVRAGWLCNEPCASKI